MGFFSQFDAKLDEKSRISIPSRFRGQFGSEPAYLTSSEDACIAVFTKEAFDKKAIRVQAMGDDTRAGRDAHRKFFGDTDDTVPDAQGRLVLTQRLMTHAGLKKPCDVLIIGAGDWFEVWDPQAYANRNEPPPEQAA